MRCGSIDVELPECFLVNALKQEADWGLPRAGGRRNGSWPTLGFLGTTELASPTSPAGCTPVSGSTDPSIVCPTFLHPPLVLSCLPSATRSRPRSPGGRQGSASLTLPAQGCVLFDMPPPGGETSLEPLAPNTPSLLAAHISSSSKGGTRDVSPGSCRTGGGSRKRRGSGTKASLGHQAPSLCTL